MIERQSIIHQVSEAAVSVIIPGFNAEASLGKAIDSALNQGVRTQVIVVNDGSTDGTAAVARRFGDRITYVEQPNQGQGAGRNTGLQLATHSYVSFLDSDDYWKPNFLRTCVNFLESRPDAMAVSTGFEVLRNGRVSSCFPPDGNHLPVPADGQVLDDFFGFWAANDHVRTGTVVMRASLVEKAGLQRTDLRISQDLEYWAYTATFGAWGFIPERLWVGNSRAASASNWTQKYRARRKLCPRVEEWEARVLPRLSERQYASFCKVRGRVAAGFAHSKILAGDDAAAREIVIKYGGDMPVNSITKLLSLGHGTGRLGWRLACAAVRSKESFKIARMQIEHRLGRIER